MPLMNTINGRIYVPKLNGINNENHGDILAIDHSLDDLI